MKKRSLTILLAVLVLLFASSMVFFLRPYRRSAIAVQIGVPISFDDAGNVASVYYGKVLTSQQETDILLLAMLNAQTMPWEDVPKEKPDAMITIHYHEAGYMYPIWFWEDLVVFGNEHTLCKGFRNDHTDVVPFLKNYVENLKNNQNNP